MTNIMKRLFSFAVLLVVLPLASPALAEHHRGHAIIHLDNSCAQLKATRLALTRFEDSLENPRTGFFSRVRLNLELAIEDCEEVAFLLQDGEDLDVIRRRLTQPTGANPKSTVRALFFALYEVAFTVVGSDGADYDQFHRAIRRLSHGWSHADLAIWHVTDAIREEIYDDPDFQE